MPRLAKALSWTVGGLLVLGLAFVLGPRVPADTTVHPISLAPDLDRFLEEQEGRLSDIMPGTEKRIVWNDHADPAVTRLSLVYLHGFSATRQEIRPVAERAASDLGANLFLTRLRGHGRPGEALAQVTMNDWINDAAEAMEIGLRIGERVVVVGTSTGATLALWAGAQERWADRVAALVLISPNVRPSDPAAALLTWPWGERIARLAVGETREWEPANAEQARYWTTRYPVEALLPMAALVKTAASLDLSTVRPPTLVLYSSRDQVVSVPAILQALDALGGEPVESVDMGAVGDPQNHVLAGDILSPESTDSVVAAINAFVRKTAEGS